MKKKKIRYRVFVVKLYILSFFSRDCKTFLFDCKKTYFLLKSMLHLEQKTCYIYCLKNKNK